jgi:hypothetical protein
LPNALVYFAQLGDGPVPVPLVEQRDAQVVAGDGVARADGDGGAEPRLALDGGRRRVDRGQVAESDEQSVVAGARA